MDVFTEKETYQFLIESGIISSALVQDAQEKMIDQKRKELLSQHPFSVWQGKNGSWYTYLPDPQKGRKLVKKTTRKAIDDCIISYAEKAGDSFRERWAVWVERQRECGIAGDSTISHYEREYRRFFEGDPIEAMRVQTISTEDLSEFFMRCLKKKPMPWKAFINLTGYINGVLEKCRKDRLITENPYEFIDRLAFRKHCVEKDRKTKDLVFSADEKIALQKSLERTQQAKPEFIPQYAVELNGFLGVRPGELAGLKWSDIDYDAKTITFQRSEKYNELSKEYYIAQTKNCKVHVSPLTDEMEEVLERLKAVEAENGFLSEWVFSDDRGRVSKQRISDCVRNRTRAKAFAKPKCMYTLRRTVNSDFRKAGASAVQASALIGNSPAVNNTCYTFDTTELAEKREIVEKTNKATKLLLSNQK